MILGQKSWSGIHIVCGFSSSGKSEYIRHILATDQKFRGATPVSEEMFRKKERDRLIAGDVFHLDIANDKRKFWPRYTAGVHNHPIAVKGVFSRQITSVDFLVVPESLLRKLIKKRGEFNDDLNLLSPNSSYPVKAKLQALDACPLEKRYAVWFDYFEAQEACVRLIYSGDRNYKEILGRRAGERIITDGFSRFR